MSDQTTAYLLFALFFVPTLSVVLFVLLRAKRRKEWAWHRLVDFAEHRTDASRGLPESANDALVAMFEASAAGETARLEDTKTLGVPGNIRDGVGQTPLLVAANAANTAGPEWLVRNGATVNAADALGETALLKASRVGALPIVELLLRSGASPECRHLEGWTPLLVAALNGNEAIVRILLAHGANAAATAHGKTPEVLAKQQGHLAVATLLAGA